MKKKLIRNFKQELKNLEKHVDNLNDITSSGGVNSDEDYQLVLKDAERLYAILAFLNHTGIIGNKKYTILMSRIIEAEHWFLPFTSNNEAFM